MDKLYDIVKLQVNNQECVVLEVKEDDCSYFKLIGLGYFNGNEKCFRMTKGENQTCTIFYKDRSPFTWNLGRTCVTPNVRKMGRIVLDCMEKDFGIRIRY